MDILVIGSDDADRARSFQQHARAAGHRVLRAAPGKHIPVASDAWLGVVCFEPNGLEMVLDDIRYLSSALIVVSSEPRSSDLEPVAYWFPHGTPDAVLLKHLIVECEAMEVSASLRGDVMEPLIAAVSQTLVEMAGVEVRVRSVDQRTTPAAWGDCSSVLAIKADVNGLLILSFSASTAAALGRRVFAEVKQELDPAMIQDCIGEIANVVAGQTKALLAGTPYHFVFSPPLSVTEDIVRLASYSKCLVIAFDSDVGNLVLQLCHSPK